MNWMQGRITDIFKYRKVSLVGKHQRISYISEIWNSIFMNRLKLEFTLISFKFWVLMLIIKPTESRIRKQLSKVTQQSHSLLFPVFDTHLFELSLSIHH